MCGSAAGFLSFTRGRTIASRWRFKSCAPPLTAQRNRRTAFKPVPLALCCPSRRSNSFPCLDPPSCSLSGRQWGIERCPGAPLQSLHSRQPLRVPSIITLGLDFKLQKSWRVRSEKGIWNIVYFCFCYLSPFKALHLVTHCVRVLAGYFKILFSDK